MAAFVKACRAASRLRSELDHKYRFGQEAEDVPAAPYVAETSKRATATRPARERATPPATETESR